MRSFSNDVWLFEITSVISLAGMGIGNVLIPPVIKSYFPDRIGLVTSIYAAAISVSAALPSLVAVPVTQLGGWRVSTSMWAGLALIAAVPWVILLSGSQKPVQSQQHHKYSAWGWPTAWAISILFGVGALNNYTMIAWLPKILTSSAGVSQASSGLMLSMYNLIGFPHGLVVPIILSRTKRPMYVIAIGITCLLIGYLGLAYLTGLCLDMDFPGRDWPFTDTGWPYFDQFTQPYPGWCGSTLRLYPRCRIPVGRYRSNCRRWLAFIDRRLDVSLLVFAYYGARGFWSRRNCS